MYESPLLIEHKYKKTHCKFCLHEIVSQHFVRHLENKHRNEKEVIELSLYPKKDTRRKHLVTLLRNNGNLGAALQGAIIPKRLIKNDKISQNTHIICPTCKSYFKKGYLFRHTKTCFAKNKKQNISEKQSAVMNSYIYSACHKKYGDILNKMHVKSEVLSRMRPDNVAKEILNDILILSWGDDLLKKTPSHRSKYHITAKMRRCANFLIQMRLQNPRYTNMLSCLRPDAFDDAIAAIKVTSKYNEETRKFGSAATALQFGCYLKQISDMTIKIIFRKKIKLPVAEIEPCIKNLKRFKELIASQWTTELGSLAMKDLTVKAGKKILVLPLTEDVIKLKKYIDEKAEEAYKSLLENPTKKAYLTLAQTTLITSIIHNRKRQSDVQYLQLEFFEEQRKSRILKTGVVEFMASLSECERIMVNNYFKYTCDGKGSRNYPVLVPQDKLRHYDLLLKIRKEKTGFNESGWFPVQNIYFFAQINSRRWIDFPSNILKYGKEAGAKHPELLTTSKLRKHVATVTQLLSLRPNEVEQLSKFMGHTKKTHETFYK